MKTTRANLIAILIIAMVVPMATMTGCSTTAQRRAANTLESVHAMVDRAYDGYIDLVIQGTLTTNSFPAIAHHYTLFQQAYTAAVLIVAGDTNGIAPVSITTQANNVTTAIGVALRGDKK